MKSIRLIAVAASMAGFMAAVIASAAVWSPVAPMHVGRSRHTATLLPGGTVLVAGGLTGDFNPPATTGTAELFEPSTGAWIVTGALNVPRSRHTATLLPNGLVLVAGGRDSAGFALDSSELYNPSTGKWVLTRTLNVPRDSHTATLLADGRVLVAGGWSVDDSFDNPVEKSAEIYDYRTGQWSRVDSMSVARFGHSATLLPDGGVLVAGGGGPRGDGVYTRTAEIFDPAAGKWRPVVPMLSERAFHIAQALGDGTVLVTGGYTLPAAEENKTLASERWLPAQSRWVAAGDMSLPRAAFAGVPLANGQFLVTGSRTATAELFDSAAGIWSPTASMNEPRTWHRLVMLFDGRVLACGGENKSGAISSSELFTP